MPKREEAATAPQPRITIRDPGYRYPESDNPYWLKLKSYSGLVYSDNETETHAGRWLDRFPLAPRLKSKPSPLHVEVGCNGGHVILEMAARHPDVAFIGLDWKFKQICRGAEKARTRGLGNLLFFRAHAERLRFMFGAGEIDCLNLFFPDPWPRKSQWKNRSVTPENLQAFAKLVRPGGIFHIKTDHSDYFQWMERVVSEVSDSWSVAERTTDLHAGHPDPTAMTFPEVTLFEKVFIRERIPIKSLKLTRR